MALTWTQRREALLSDCIVSPDVFNPMIARLAAFVVPYQQALETEAAQRNLHLSLQGLLSHMPSKNAEDIATFVDVDRKSTRLNSSHQIISYAVFCLKKKKKKKKKNHRQLTSNHKLDNAR